MIKELAIKTYGGQITANFNIEEFSCNANKEVLLTPEVMAHIKRLQKFRFWYRRVMSINSGYRTKEYNTRIGGSPRSKHMEGIATDFMLPQEYYLYSKKRQNQFLNNIKKKWLSLCKEDGLGGGVGFYNTFIHLDSRAKGSYKTGVYAFWDSRK